MPDGPGPTRSSTETAPVEEALAEPAEDPLLAGLERPFTVLVTGASGFLGRHLIERLVSRGHNVRAACRGGRPDGAVARPEVTWLAADLREADAVEGLCRDCDVVAHLAGQHREEDGQTFRQVHVEGTVNLVEQARAAGVERVLMVSAHGAASGEHPYFRTKLEAEDTVRRSGVEFVVVRPDLVVGPDDHFTSILARWVARAPLCCVPGAAEGRYRPVDVEDVTDALCQSVERADLSGRTFTLSGPDELSLGDVVEAVVDACGLRRPVVPLPGAMGRPVLEGARGIGRVLGLPVDAWELLWRRRDLTPPADDAALRSVFHIEPMPFGEALGDYL